MYPDPVHERLNEFDALCRKLGIPLTVQRRTILQTVLERSDHPTAEQIAEAVKQQVPGISRTTVYRVLDTLVELGMVRRVHHSGPSARFDGRTGRHHHLICRLCHKVIDLDSSRLDRIRPPEKGAEGFEIEDFSVHFSGVCADCGRANQEQAAQKSP